MTTSHKRFLTSSLDTTKYRRRKLPQRDFEVYKNGVWYTPSKGSANEQSFFPFDLKYSDQQLAALQYALQGYNLFLSGSAGCGKSTITKQEIIKLLRYAGKNVVVTGTTGVSGIDMGGVTIHLFAGIQIAQEDDLHYFRLALHNETVRAHWDAVQVLVIDEISMMTPEYYHKLNLFVCAIAYRELYCTERNIHENTRRNKGKRPELKDKYLFDIFMQRMEREKWKPMGDKQILLSGDFAQLPPIQPGYVEHDEDDVRYICEMDIWERLIDKNICLKDNFRQLGNEEFITLLEHARFGQITDHDHKLLLSCVNRKFPDDGIDATTLFSRKDAVSKRNRQKIAELPEPEFTYETKITETTRHGSKEYKAADGIDDDDEERASRHIEKLRHQIKRACPADETLNLRIGAQVMLIVNFNQGAQLVNGSRGVVIDFQGPDEDMWPVVRFTTGAELLIGPSLWVRFIRRGWNRIQSDVCHQIQHYDPKVPLVIQKNPKIERLHKLPHIAAQQLPLRIAYALTIHKCQGATLDRLQLSCSNIFEDGQLYVGLSRVRTLEGLSLTNYSRKSIRADPRVVKYYKTLEETAEPVPKYRDWKLMNEMPHYIPEDLCTLTCQYMMNFPSKHLRTKLDEIDE